MLNSIVTQKGQVTIPAKIRASLHIQPGDVIRFIQKDHHIELKKKKTDISESFGIIKAKKGVSLKDMENTVSKDTDNNFT